MYEILYAALWETASEESQTIYLIERKDVRMANFKQARSCCTLVASCGGCLQLFHTLGFHHAFEGSYPWGCLQERRGPEAVCVSRAIKTWPRLGSTAGRAVRLLLLDGLALLVAS